MKWSSAGALALLVNVHKYDAFINKKELAEKYKRLNEKLRYPYQGAPNRDKYYFKRSILGINRLINYVASRPDFDKKHFVMSGSSQGGGHALILAGLNKHITAVKANVPALCDHSRDLLGALPGWPRLVRKYHGKEEYRRMMNYFDVVNFARMIKCPTAVYVGFIDETCSPSSIYAAYNVIKAPKEIIADPLMGHVFSDGFKRFASKWEKKHLGLLAR
jgi:cephalosporin-C deacetylase-like acetyl esterase